MPVPGAVEELHDSRQTLRALFETMSQGVVFQDAAGRIVEANPAAQSILGLTLDQMLGRTSMDPRWRSIHEDGSDFPGETHPAMVALATGKPVRGVVMGIFDPGVGQQRWIEVSSVPVFAPGQSAPYGVYSIFEDITERKQTEYERQILIDVLSLVNSPNSTHELLRQVIVRLSEWSGCEAVGIRLKEGDDFPYYETRGFPPEFVRAENRLCALDASGNIERDSGGAALLECLCGSVLLGGLSPSLPNCTSGGSFWTNNAVSLFAQAGPESLPPRVRGRCPAAGYESVALVPLKAMGEIHGLLQFNDRRPDRFDARRIELFERLAADLALGLAQRKMARSLRLSEERWQFALEGAGDGVWDWDVQTGEVYFSPRWKSMLGFEEHEIAGRLEEWEKRVHPDDKPQVMEAIRLHLAGQSPLYTSEHRVQAKDGSWKWILDRGKVMRRDPDGRPLRMVGTHTDITERKRAEQALRESEYWLRESQRVSRIGTYVFDAATGRWTSSETLDEIFGIGADYERTVEGWSRLIHPDHRAGMLDYFFNDVLGCRNQFDREYKIVRQGDGQTRWVHGRGALTLDASGHPVAMAGTIQDITERKNIEEQLLQAQKLESIGLLAGGVAHDFNNLLTVINGYSNLLLARLPETDPIRRQVAEIRRAGERAAALTQQLLAFSRRQVIRPSLLDLNAIIRDSEGLLHRLIGESVRLETRLAPVLGLVKADANQISQVLMNLAANARDAMPDGGRLTIETSNVRIGATGGPGHPGRRPGPYVLLAVSDSGAGMDEETRRRVFEPFFTTKPEGRGVGLGLSMVYGIVNQCGGWIEVDSKPGGGSTFRVFLPRAGEQDPGARPEPDRCDQAPAAGTILIVEDQENVRGLAAAVLGDRGYRVLEAGSGEQALAVSEQHPGPIDLLLTDVIMPGMQGGELATRLKASRPRLRTLFMSGYTGNGTGRPAELGEDAHFLQKPFTPDELAEKVRALLAAGPGPPTILVADDEAAVRTLFQEVLSRAGYHVLTADDGAKVLRLLRERRIDLVITDLVMPDREGIETIAEIRRGFPGVKIIAVSGAFGGRFLKTASLIGAHATLSKPVSAEALTSAVGRLLRGA